MHRQTALSGAEEVAWAGCRPIPETVGVWLLLLTGPLVSRRPRLTPGRSSFRNRVRVSTRPAAGAAGKDRSGPAFSITISDVVGYRPRPLLMTVVGHQHVDVAATKAFHYRLLFPAHLAVDALHPRPRKSFLSPLPPWRSFATHAPGQLVVFICHGHTTKVCRPQTSLLFDAAVALVHGEVSTLCLPGHLLSMNGHPGRRK